MNESENIILQVSEKEIPLLKEYYTQKLEKNIKEKESIELILEQLERSHTDHEPSVFGKTRSKSPDLNNDDPLDLDYNINWTWRQKIYHILKGNEMTTSEIVNKVMDLEPGRVRSRVVASVSANLSAKSKTDDDLYRKRLNERNENIYSINTAAQNDNKEQS